MRPCALWGQLITSCWQSPRKMAAIDFLTYYEGIAFALQSRDFKICMTRMTSIVEEKIDGSTIWRG